MSSFSHVSSDIGQSMSQPDIGMSGGSSFSATAAAQAQAEGPPVHPGNGQGLPGQAGLLNQAQVGQPTQGLSLGETQVFQNKGSSVGGGKGVWGNGGMGGMGGMGITNGGVGGGNTSGSSSDGHGGVGIITNPSGSPGVGIITNSGVGASGVQPDDVMNHINNIISNLGTTPNLHVHPYPPHLPVHPNHPHLPVHPNPPHLPVHPFHPPIDPGPMPGVDGQDDGIPVPIPPGTNDDATLLENVLQGGGPVPHGGVVPNVGVVPHGGVVPNAGVVPNVGVVPPVPGVVPNVGVVPPVPGVEPGGGIDDDLNPGIPGDENDPMDGGNQHDFGNGGWDPNFPWGNGGFGGYGGHGGGHGNGGYPGHGGGPGGGGYPGHGGGPGGGGGPGHGGGPGNGGGPPHGSASDAAIMEMTKAVQLLAESQASNQNQLLKTTMLQLQVQLEQVKATQQAANESARKNQLDELKDVDRVSQRVDLSIPNFSSLEEWPSIRLTLLDQAKFVELREPRDVSTQVNRLIRDDRCKLPSKISVRTYLMGKTPSLKMGLVSYQEERDLRGGIAAIHGKYGSGAAGMGSVRSGGEGCITGADPLEDSGLTAGAPGQSLRMMDPTEVEPSDTDIVWLEEPGTGIRFPGVGPRFARLEDPWVRKLGTMGSYLISRMKDPILGLVAGGGATSQLGDVVSRLEQLYIAQTPLEAEVAAAKVNENGWGAKSCPFAFILHLFQELKRFPAHFVPKQYRRNIAKLLRNALPASFSDIRTQFQLTEPAIPAMALWLKFEQNRRQLGDGKTTSEKGGTGSGSGRDASGGGAAPGGGGKKAEKTKAAKETALLAQRVNEAVNKKLKKAGGFEKKKGKGKNAGKGNGKNDGKGKGKKAGGKGKKAGGKGKGTWESKIVCYTCGRTGHKSDSCWDNAENAGGENKTWKPKPEKAVVPGVGSGGSGTGSVPKDPA